MPGVNVRRDGVGSPEPTADREHTQVANLCYEGEHTQVENLCYGGAPRQVNCGSTRPASAVPNRIGRMPGVNVRRDGTGSPEPPRHHRASRGRVYQIFFTSRFGFGGGSVRFMSSLGRLPPPPPPPSLFFSLTPVWASSQR